jgi:NAD+ synthetase
MKIALAQINTRVGDLSGNFRKIAEFTDRAKKEGADLVIFPEMAVNGYPPMDLLDNRAFVRAGVEKLNEVAALSRGIAVVCGYVSENTSGKGRPCRNSLALCIDGKTAATVHKSLLPTYDVFDEDRYFEPTSPEEARPVELGGLKFGFSICEDIWNDRLYGQMRQYRFDPIEKLVSEGAQILVNISASPYYLGKRAKKMEMFGGVARRHGVPLIAVNLVGGNTELIFDGGSAAFGRDGAPFARAKCFDEDIIVIDTKSNRRAMSPWPECDEEDLLQALELGIRDYLHKCGFTKAVIGLSGGIDSAVTAAIAVRALGAENVLGVTMPSRYTSGASTRDAKALADNLGIRLETVEIEPMFRAYLKQFKSLFRDMPADVAEENLQARIRGNILMAISNKFGHIVLATGNKSELAMGYCTLYGDMSGGLSVIGDVPKTMAYRLAEHINRDEEIIPSNTITRPPSAELRPDQTDQDALPPYELLDAVLQAYIEEHKELEEIVGEGRKREEVERILRTVDRNEYKRKQAAPCLKVTHKAFGSGRRLPIVQGWR